MGLLDWLMGGPRVPRGAIRVLPEVEDPRDYEEAVRALAALGGLELDVSCRAAGRAVSLELVSRGRRYVHTQHGFFADIGALLPILDECLPPTEKRRFVEVGDDMGEQVAVALVDDEGLAALRRDGHRLLTRDAPRTGRRLVDGIELGGVVTFHEDGSPKAGMLADEAVIDEIPCAAGATIVFDVIRRGDSRPRGRLLRATTSQPIAAGDLLLPAGTHVELYEEGGPIAIATLEVPATIAGIELPPATELHFNESARLYMATLGAPLDRGGPLAGERGPAYLPAGTSIGFGDDRWCFDDIDLPAPPEPLAPRAEIRTLEHEQIIEGHRLPAKTEVTTREGRLESARLPTATVIDGVPCEAGPIDFAFGRLAFARLSERFVHGNLVCRAHTSILLWDDGGLSAITLDEPAVIAAFTLPAGTRVGFYDSLSPAIFVLPTHVQVGGRDCIAGQTLRLTEDGTIAEVGHIADAAYRHEYTIVNGVSPHVDLA